METHCVTTEATTDFNHCEKCRQNVSCTRDRLLRIQVINYSERKPPRFDLEHDF